MVLPAQLGASEREQLSDARLLLESAVHNTRIIEALKGYVDEDGWQGLVNAASQAAQAAAALKRVVKARQIKG